VTNAISRSQQAIAESESSKSPASPWAGLSREYFDRSMEGESDRRDGFRVSSDGTVRLGDDDSVTYSPSWAKLTLDVSHLHVGATLVPTVSENRSWIVGSAETPEEELLGVIVRSEDVATKILLNLNDKNGQGDQPDCLISFLAPVEADGLRAFSGAWVCWAYIDQASIRTLVASIQGRRLRRLSLKALLTENIFNAHRRDLGDAVASTRTTTKWIRPDSLGSGATAKGEILSVEFSEGSMTLDIAGGNEVESEQVSPPAGDLSSASPFGQEILQASRQIATAISLSAWVILAGLVVAAWIHR